MGGLGFGFWTGLDRFGIFGVSGVVPVEKRHDIIRCVLFNTKNCYINSHSSPPLIELTLSRPSTGGCGDVPVLLCRNPVPTPDPNIPPPTQDPSLTSDEDATLLSPLKSDPNES